MYPNQYPTPYQYSSPYQSSPQQSYNQYYQYQQPHSQYPNRIPNNPSSPPTVTTQSTPITQQNTFSFGSFASNGPSNPFAPISNSQQNPFLPPVKELEEKDSDQERINEEKERKRWSFCTICCNEYLTNDIRMSEECLHSFCYECIIQSTKNGQFLFCPVCSTDLKISSLSSLPNNYSIQLWISLSPPKNNLNNCDNRNNSIAVKNQFKICKNHESEEMKLFCEICQKFICDFCIDDHYQHTVISIHKYSDTLKQQWKLDLTEEIKIIQLKFQQFKDQFPDDKDFIKQIDTKINITNRFLFSFIENLDYSYFANYENPNYLNFAPLNPFNDNIKRVKIINSNNNQRKRIHNFFERENIKQIYSSFLPQKEVQKQIFAPKIISETKTSDLPYFKQIIQKEFIFNTFNVPTEPNLASNPKFISIADQILAISEIDELVYGRITPPKANQITICDWNGNINLVITNQRAKPSGIKLLPKRKIILVAWKTLNQIILYNYENGQPIGVFPPKENSFSLMYEPQGVAVIDKFDLIAVCSSDKRIHFIKLSTGKYHSSILLNEFPFAIAVSQSAKLLIVTLMQNHSVYIYSFDDLNNKKNIVLIADEIRKTKINQNIELKMKLGERRSDRNEDFSYPMSVAIHSKANYFVVVDSNNHRLKFYSLDGQLKSIFAPSAETTEQFVWKERNYYFDSPVGLDIDKKNNIIVVSCFPSRTSITLLHLSQIFS